MHRTRLYIAGTHSGGLELQLDPDQSRYVGRVLRLRLGNQLLIFDGEGNEFVATITEISRQGVNIRVDRQTTTHTESDLRLHIVQGVSRTERMDLVVQKATELGVKRITPVLTRRGIVKLDRTRAEKRRGHWQKISASACEQSGRVRLPLIDTPLPLVDWLDNKPAEVDTELVLRPDAKMPLGKIPAPETKVCILIGPEGGLDDAELEAAETAGFMPVSLGPRILRTETAALAALAILQSLWGDLG